MAGHLALRATILIAHSWSCVLPLLLEAQLSLSVYFCTATQWKWVHMSNRKCLLDTTFSSWMTILVNHAIRSNKPPIICLQNWEENGQLLHQCLHVVGLIYAGIYDITIANLWNIKFQVQLNLSINIHTAAVQQTYNRHAILYNMSMAYRNYWIFILLVNCLGILIVEYTLENEKAFFVL